MFCSNCGAQVGDNEKFCKACGTPVNVQAAAPVMQPIPDYQQPVPEQPVSAPKRGRTYGPQERRKANRLCILSLILSVGVPLIMGILLGLVENLGLSANNYYSFLMIAEFPIAGAVIAGIVLMIVVRIKYSKSKFGLILMILYCVYLAVALLLFIFALSSCSDFIGSSSCS